MTTRSRWFAVCAAAAFAADQLTKLWARRALVPGVESPVWDGVWVHRLAYNRGSAFSLVADGGAFLVVFGVVACVVILLLVRRTPQDRRAAPAALGLVAGGLFDAALLAGEALLAALRPARRAARSGGGREVRR